MIRPTLLLLTTFLLLAGCTGDPDAAPGPPKAAGPAKAEDLYDRGLTVQRAGDVHAGIKLFYAAIGADPSYAAVLNHLAWLRATDTDARLRDGKEAVRLSEAACKVAVDEKSPSIFAANCLDTLAAAYAEAGRFREAIAAAKRAAAAARGVGNRRAARQFEGRIELFEQGKPLHERGVHAK